ncbi:PIG-L deacetylase family protein [Brevibacillus sp. B_LB10_24]|uniref:PIG-L deacetylase family protein n=1 Tax=Brevibacillus sp. B_LB10_24 TaxID=3380645 RepID=UPI0038B9A182
MSQKRILFVFAHPDDETFTSGVTIAKYTREENATVALLCATRGQAGKAGDPPICTAEELPAVRERELREAARILGINQLDILDYQDKHLSDVPIDELAGRIVSVIAKVQPQVVITFAPHGISGHPDHRAISQATARAVSQLAPDSPVKKLYFCTLPRSGPFPARTIYTDPDEAITTHITAPEYVDVTAKALLAHRTQHLSVERVFPGIAQGDYRHVRDTNYFILAWNRLPSYRLNGKESDLFAGI